MRSRRAGTARPNRRRVFHRLSTAAFATKGDRARGKTVENATRLARLVAAGGISGLRQRGHFYFAQKGTFLLCVDKHGNYDVPLGVLR